MPPRAVLSGKPTTATTGTAPTYTYAATDSATSAATTPETFTITIVNERPVLQALYNNTNGDTWTSQTDTDMTNDWPKPLTAATCLNDLAYVTLSSSGTLITGRVQTLAPAGNNLSGPLPNLSSLTSPDRPLSRQEPTDRADSRFPARQPAIPHPQQQRN